MAEINLVMFDYTSYSWLTINKLRNQSHIIVRRTASNRWGERGGGHTRDNPSIPLKQVLTHTFGLVMQQA